MSLSPQQIMQNRKDALEILQSCVPYLPDETYAFLDNSDYWTAPASTKYHEAYEGGLIEHSLMVFERLTMLNYQHFLELEDDTIAKVALFHDLCKTNFYRKAIKNKKMEDGRWLRVEGYEVEDSFPLGHGEKSVALLLVHGVPLTEPEMLAIRYHMGGFTEGVQSFIGGQALSGAMGSSKLVVALQIADMMAVWL